MEAAEVKPCFVGIDVSKKMLDIYSLPQKTRFQVENGDFKKLCKQLKSLSPRLIILEASGGYEDGAYRALAKAGFKVRREHASLIYHHRKSRGKRAKTDNIDAETIAMLDAIFAGRHFPPAVIMWAVRWYCRYPLSYRNVEEMLEERGAFLDHATVARWVQVYGAELESRLRRQPKQGRDFLAGR